MKLEPPIHQNPIAPAHRLFTPNQPLLWLPGLPGEHVAFCSYNEMRGDPGSGTDRRLIRKPAFDNKEAYFAPPYPVSPETSIAWHTNVSPPFPFHPVPIAHTLSPDELSILARRVIQLMGRNPASSPEPLVALSNDNKCFVIAALAAMGILPTISDDSGPSTRLRLGVDGGISKKLQDVSASLGRGADFRHARLQT